MDRKTNSCLLSYNNDIKTSCMLPGGLQLKEDHAETDCSAPTVIPASDQKLFSEESLSSSFSSSCGIYQNPHSNMHGSPQQMGVEANGCSSHASLTKHPGLSRLRTSKGTRSSRISPGRWWKWGNRMGLEQRELCSPPLKSPEPGRLLEKLTLSLHLSLLLMFILYF